MATNRTIERLNPATFNAVWKLARLWDTDAAGVVNVLIGCLVEGDTWAIHTLPARELLEGWRRELLEGEPAEEL